jgi:hypothetical protein
VRVLVRMIGRLMKAANFWLRRLEYEVDTIECRKSASEDHKQRMSQSPDVEDGWNQEIVWLLIVSPG